MDFDIPLPHILLPLALSFVTFQQIAFLYDCYKRAKGQLRENLNMDFIDYALFISFFPQLIAGPIVHHREMMPQFARLGGDSSCHINSCLTDKSCHTKHSLCHTDKPCHTECSEVSKSQNCLSNTSNCHIERSEISTQNTEFMDFSPTAQNDKMQHFTQNDKNSAKSQINYEFLAKGIFIFSIGLFKKVFIADSFAKWADAGFSKVENGVILNMAESWATSLSYTFQLYFDFSGYCDMAIGLGLMFGIVLPLNFNSPYKSLNIAEFWRRWHITLGRFLTECVYVPLGGNRVSKILNLRNIFIVFFLSGVWHGAGWGFVIWGILHALAMMVHRIYGWWVKSLKLKSKSLQNFANAKSWQSTQICYISEKSKTPNCHIERSKVSKSQICHIERSEISQTNSQRDFSPTAQNDKMRRFTQNDSTYTMRFLAFTQSKIYKILAWLITFNFINIAWIFFRAENLIGAVNLLKGMFGIVWVDLPQKAYKANQLLKSIDGTDRTFAYILIAIVVCLACRNSFEKLQNFSPTWLNTLFITTITTIALFSLLASEYTPFLYFNF